MTSVLLLQACSTTILTLYLFQCFVYNYLLKSQRSSVVEQRFRKPQVKGSNLFASYHLSGISVLGNLLLEPAKAVVLHSSSNWSATLVR